MSESDKKDDTTGIGGVAPAIPKLPSQPAPSQPSSARQPGEATRVSDAPPVLPGQPAAPPAAPPVGDRRGTPAVEDEDATIIIPRDTTRPRFSLNRMQPPGHSEPVVLERDAYLVGRAPTSDVRLYSASASREHARLTRRGDAWYLARCEDKVVLVNGAAVLDEVRLEHKMRLQLGDDELLVIDRLAPVELPSTSAAPRGASAGARWWIVLLIAAAVLVAAGLWVLSRS